MAEFYPTHLYLKTETGTNKDNLHSNTNKDEIIEFPQLIDLELMAINNSPLLLLSKGSSTATFHTPPFCAKSVAMTATTALIATDFTHLQTSLHALNCHLQLRPCNANYTSHSSHYYSTFSYYF